MRFHPLEIHRTKKCSITVEPSGGWALCSETADRTAGHFNVVWKSTGTLWNPRKIPWFVVICHIKNTILNSNLLGFWESTTGSRSYKWPFLWHPPTNADVEDPPLEITFRTGFFFGFPTYIYIYRLIFPRVSYQKGSRFWHCWFCILSASWVWTCRNPAPNWLCPALPCQLQQSPCRWVLVELSGILTYKHIEIHLVLWTSGYLCIYIFVWFCMHIELNKGIFCIYSLLYDRSICLSRSPCFHSKIK